MGSSESPKTKQAGELYVEGFRALMELHGTSPEITAVRAIRDVVGSPNTPLDQTDAAQSLPSVKQIILAYEQITGQQL